MKVTGLYNMRDILKKNNFPWAQLAIILTGIVLYANTFDVPFYLDDFRNINDNKAIQIQSLNFGSITAAATESPLSGRPLANISFALNYYWGGLNVFGYHLVNSIIHIITGLTLFLFFRLTFETPALRTKYHSGHLIAFLAAVLWLAHPIQTQSVTYVVQRMNSMATMFYILAFWSYAKGRFASKQKTSIFYFGGTFAAWLLAMGSKEIAATLPFILFLYEWVFFQKGEIVWLKRKMPYLAGLIVILLVAVIFYLGKEPWDYLLNSYEFRHFSPKERVLTQFRIVFFYVSLLLFPVPWRLGLEHDFTLSTSFFQPLSTAVFFTGIVILIVYALADIRRRPLLSFSILWFLGNQVIESSIIPLELVFEHRMYLPSMFFFLPVCTIILQRRSTMKIALAFVVCSSVLFGAATYARNNDWKDPVHFWQKNIEHAPKNVRAHNNLGEVLLRQGRFAESMRYLEEAVRLNPFFFPAHNNLGMVHLRQRNLTEAVKHFQKALFYNKDLFEAHLNLGGIYGEMGNYQLGLTHLREAVRIDPASASAHNNIANLLQLLGRYDESIFHYDEALKINPEYGDARYNRQIAIKRLMKQRQGLYQ
jgi:Tfp pilus assembly protein PilF